MPAMPPPMTKALLVTGTSMVSRGLSNRALATAMLIMSFAFAVASFGVLGWHHEENSRMFAISNKNGFNPASLTVFLKVGSCILGLQAATTTRFNLYSFIAFLISSCPGSAHV